MISQHSQIAAILRNDSGIAAEYVHAPKHVTPGEMIEVPGAVLKWYGLHRASQSIPQALTDLARSTLAAAKLTARGPGFVILHRCGKDFYFLIVCTWRGSNEVWETVFYKDGDAMPQFAIFPRDDVHKPTFCVWELVPVWHEKQAWERFLLSSRDDAAAEVWLSDIYEGPA